MNQNKILVKNTIAQYIRIIVSVIIHLFSTRIVLQQLGIDDYGIFSVIASFIALFGVLNNSMIVSVQRFLSIAINKNKQEVQIIYVNSQLIHFIFSVLVLFLAETIGLYFFLNYMTFPAEKLRIATIVYHCVIVIFVFNIMSIPQQASLIAFEKIYLSAVIGIIDVFLKLFVALSLLFFSENRLLIYVVSLLCISIIIYFIYSLLVRHYLNLRFRFNFDKLTIRKLLGFASWNLLGGIANLGKIQGVNVLLNMFCGTSVNAAYGIANQVNSQLLFFSSSIFQSSNSQIVRSYHSGDFSRLNYLVCMSTKFAFSLLFIVTLPIYICADEILLLWLGEVPQYCGTFLQLMLLNSYIELFSSPLMFIMQAYGKIKWYFLCVSFVLIMILPISYVYLSNGFSPDIVLLVTIYINCILLFIRMLYVVYSAKFSCKFFLCKVLFPSSIFIVAGIIIFSSLKGCVTMSPLYKIVLFYFLDFCILGAAFLSIYFNSDERNSIFRYILKRKCHAK